MEKASLSLRVISKLTFIGVVAGIILIIPLKILYILTGNTAYILLFNFDYIPVLNQLKPVWLFGYIFHFVTCICSVIGLYYILKWMNKQFSIISYVAVYTVGGGALFFLPVFQISLLQVLTSPPGYIGQLHMLFLVLQWVF